MGICVQTVVDQNQFEKYVRTKFLLREKRLASTYISLQTRPFLLFSSSCVSQFTNSMALGTKRSLMGFKPTPRYYYKNLHSAPTLHQMGANYFIRIDKRLFTPIQQNSNIFQLSVARLCQFTVRSGPSRIVIHFMPKQETLSNKSQK